MHTIIPKRRALLAGAVLIGVAETAEAKSSPAHSAAGGDWFPVVPGERVRIRLYSAELGGRATMLESISEPGAGAPLHTYLEDKLFHIFDGALVFEVGTRRFEAPVGTVVAVPRGVPHRWSNFSDRPAQYMATFTPGGIEHFFLQIAQVAPAEIAALAERYGTVVLGPPMQR